MISEVLRHEQVLSTVLQVIHALGNLSTSSRNGKEACEAARQSLVVEAMKARAMGSAAATEGVSEAAEQLLFVLEK